MTYAMSVKCIDHHSSVHIAFSNAKMHLHTQALADYRQTFVMKLPSLRVLDKQPVTVEEKVYIYCVTLPVQFVTVVVDWI